MGKNIEDISLPDIHKAIDAIAKSSPKDAFQEQDLIFVCEKAVDAFWAQLQQRTGLTKKHFRSLDLRE